MALVRGTGAGAGTAAKKKRKKKQPLGLGAKAGVAIRPAARPVKPQEPRTPMIETEARGRAGELPSPLDIPLIEPAEVVPPPSKAPPIPSYQALLQERQIEDLRWAWRQWKGADPSPAMLSKLLMRLPEVMLTDPEAPGYMPMGQNRRERYKKLLEPTKDVPTFTELSGFKGKEYDPDTMSGEGTTRVFSPAMQDRAWFWASTPQQTTADVLEVTRSPEYQRELHDTDLTRSEMLVHDAMTADVLFAKQELAQREKDAFEHIGKWQDVQLGLTSPLLERQPGPTLKKAALSPERWRGVDYDPTSSEWEPTFDFAYRRYLLMGQMKNLMSPDEKRRNKAWALVLGEQDAEGNWVRPNLLTDVHGNQDKAMEAVLRDAAANFETLGLEPRLAEFLYDASMYGRPFGQSEVKARWEYVNQMGRENAPPRIQAQLNEEQKNLGWVLMLPFEATTRVIENLHDDTEGKPVIGQVMDAAVYLNKNINQLLGGLGTAVGFVEGRPIGAVLNMIGLSFGTHEIDSDGQVVPRKEIFQGALYPGPEKLPPPIGKARGIGLTPGDGERKFVFDPEALTITKNWVAAWNTTQGQEGRGLGQLVDDVYLLWGEDRAKATGALDGVVATLVATGDLAIMLRGAGKGMDVGLRAGVKYVPQAAFRGGRAAYRGYKGSRWSTEAGFLDLGGKPMSKGTKVTAEEATMEGSVTRTGEVIGFDEKAGDYRLKLDDGREVWAAEPFTKPVTLPKTTEAGVKVREVEVKGEPVEVDASAADSVQRLNDNGFPTWGSHGLKEDHPTGYAPRAAEPYVEFRRIDLGKTRAARDALAGAIRAAAEKTGATFGKGTPPKGKKVDSTIVVKGDIDKFTDELISARAPEGKPPIAEPPEGPPEGPGSAELQPGEAPYQPLHYPFPLRNIAEMMAEHFNDKSLSGLTAELLRIPDDPKTKAATVAAIDEIIESKNPDVVGMKIWELTRGEVDYSQSGLAYWLRSRAEMSAAFGRAPNVFRAMGTYIAYDQEVPMRGTYRQLQNYALITKMGKRKPTAADYAKGRSIADKAWRTADPHKRQSAVHELDKLVEDNMKAEGTWEPYVKFRDSIRKASASLIMRVLGAGAQRRAYREGDRRPVARSSGFVFEEEVSRLENKVRALAKDDPQRKVIDKKLKEARKQLAGLLGDAKTWNDYVAGKIPYEQAAAAGARLDNMVSPAPVYYFQLRKHLYHDSEMNPRMLATFHGGKVARAIARANASSYNVIFGDRVMRAWKSMVMASFGFPIRVNVGDEAFRLFSEGIIPGSARWVQDRAMAKELFGGQELYGALGGKVTRGRLGATSLRALDKSERAELKALRTEDDALRNLRIDRAARKARGEGLPRAKKINLTKTERSRMSELEAKAEGTAEREIREQLFEMASLKSEYGGFNPFATDDWLLAGPKSNVPNYVPAMQDWLHQMSKEAHIRAWVDAAMPDLPKVKLEAMIRRATQTSPQGTAVLRARGIMNSAGKIVDRPGYKHIISLYAGDIGRISRHPALKGAMESGRISRKAVADMTELTIEDGTPLLWEIPVQTGVPRLHGVGGLITPFASFYENVTIPLLSAITGRLRETFFADRYISESLKLRREHPEMPIEEIHANASERALDYVQTVTFSRRTTVFEDINRNLVPFIASYRQFMVYWMRTFVKHPFAMGAAYTYNPMRDATFVNVPGVDVSFPVGMFQPFWMQKDWEQPEEGVKAIAKQSVPNANPLLTALFIAPLAEQLTEGDVGRVPGLASAKRNFAPLSALGNIYYARFGEKLFGDDPIIGRLTRPIESQERRHMEILRATVRARRRPGESPEVYYDTSPLYDFFKMLGFARPEAALSVFTHTLAPATGTYTPKFARLKAEGDAAMGAAKTMAERAAYREAHPWYDDLLTLTRESPSLELRDAILKRRPEQLAYLVGLESRSYDTYDPYRKMRTDQELRGVVRYKDDDQYAKDYADEFVSWMGGHFVPKKGGVSVFYPGDIGRPAAEKSLEAKLLRASKLARRAAKELSGGDKAKETGLFDLWKDKTDRVRADGEWHLPPRFEAWARKEGINPAELNPGELTELFQVGQSWGTEPKLRLDKPSENLTESWSALLDSGLVPKQWTDNLMGGSPLRETLDKAAVDADVKNRKTIYSAYSEGPAVEESFKLDHHDLNAMGYNAGPAFDRAQGDVSDFYYKPGGWADAKKKHGYSSSEAREARNAYFAFRARRFKGINGGEAVSGGLTKTLAIDKYFTEPAAVTWGRGPKAATDQKLWQTYISELKKSRPDIKKIRTLHSHFNTKLKNRLEDFQRVNDWIATIAVAQNLRHDMKASYSDYYQGPGNSAFSNYGKKRVAELERFIKDFYSDDQGEVREQSLFFSDISLYFDDAHSLAYKMLEWTYH